MKQITAVLTILLAAGFSLAQRNWEVQPGFQATGTPHDFTQRAPLIGPITFDEVEFVVGTPIDGVSVATLGGSSLLSPLTFGFSSMDATFTFAGPAAQTFVAPNYIEGDTAGVVTIDFGTLVGSAEFGFALNSPPPITDAVTVTAYNGANMVSTVSFDGVNTGFFFAENLATINPGQSFDSIQVTFDNVAAVRFIVDNLSYDVQASQIPTLGPIGMSILILGLVVIGAFLLYRRRVNA